MRNNCLALDGRFHIPQGPMAIVKVVPALMIRSPSKKVAHMHRKTGNKKSQRREGKGRGRASMCG